MAHWTFEPGHTAAEFRVRHMMVTWVRGHFKDIHGSLEWGQDIAEASVEVEIDANLLWTGEADRDAHLKSEDFLDVENHPRIIFRSQQFERTGSQSYRVTGDLEIRGITREVELDVQSLGEWETPFWEDGVDKGPIVRAGFVAKTRINRHDFEVSWNDTLDHGGLIVGNDVFITLDVEALQTAG